MPTSRTSALLPAPLFFTWDMLVSVRLSDLFDLLTWELQMKALVVNGLVVY